MSIVTRDVHEAALASLARTVPDPREGILGPRSVAWQLGGDLAVFLGGGRAALLQLAHPMVAYAIDHHSRTRADVIGRFQRTFRHVFAMVFGDLDDAFRAARRVHAIHTRIHGVIPDQIGSFPAGTPYHANDVQALRWVHATLVDTTIAVRECLDGEISTVRKDSYISEMNRFAQLFGIESHTTWAAHVAFVEQTLREIAVAPCAREMAMFLVGRANASQPALGRVVEAITATLLPAQLADEFGLARSRISASSVRLALAAFAPVYRRLPRSLVAIPARAEAMRRLAGRSPSRIAAWTERRLFGISRQVTGA